MIKGSKHSEKSLKLIGLSGLGRVPWNKGLSGTYHLPDRGSPTLKTRRKMRKARLGKIPWNKDKKMDSDWSWNKGLTKETDSRVKKISESLDGKKLTKKHRKTLRESHLGQKAWNKGITGLFIGDKSANWKGGKTKVRWLIPGLSQYRVWRKGVFEKDHHTCQDCGEKSRKGHQVSLQAHHVKEVWRIIDEYKLKTSEDCLTCAELWDISNGVTLCEKCHKKRHKIINKKTMRVGRTGSNNWCIKKRVSFNGNALDWDDMDEIIFKTVRDARNALRKLKESLNV